MKRLGLCTALVAFLLGRALPAAQAGGELRFCLPSEPRTFNPLAGDDNSSAAVRYLTGGVLVRINRISQKVQPELATEWNRSRDGKRVQFKLREGVRYSDGTPFSAEDVAYTMQQLMDPGLHSSTADAFRSSEGTVTTRVISPTAVEINFPAPLSNAVELFDTVAIVSSKSPHRETAALGPFYVEEHKAGSYIRFKRNPNYWKKDASGRQLPYLDAVRIDIEQNRDIEALRYLRGEIHLINNVPPAAFKKMADQNPALVRDLGASVDTEQLWFNQAPTAPIPSYKQAWFRSTAFRRAVSEAIHRDDLARIVYHGYAKPAIGIIPASNRFWFNSDLKEHPYDPDNALRRLQQEGFRLDNGTLRDKSGHAVEFSLVTQAGRQDRENMAAMIQQDLKKIGVKVTLAPLDFNSLVERISDTYDYEACLLGYAGGDLDPNSVMTVWLSSGNEHAWNPKQKSPATPWEAEIDTMMRGQASSMDERKRKEYWDQVQKIAWEQEPIIFLVNKDTLVAISPSVKNAQPSILPPQAFWNIEELALAH